MVDDEEMPMAAMDGGANLLRLFEASASAKGDRPFLWTKLDGAYRPWTWSRVRAEAKALAATLAKHGIEPGDRVLIVAENRPEWCIADLATLYVGAITVPAYTTNTTEDHAYLLSHSEAKAVICSGDGLGKRLLPAVKGAGDVKLVVFMDAPARDHGLDVPVLGWEEALRIGRESSPVDHTDRLSAYDLACFIYTSGTGGRPKGVMLSHGNIIANLTGARAVIERLGLDEEVFLSFLPLSHAYEHTAGQFLPIQMGAQIYYAEGVETLSSNLVEVRPTFMTCVPRLYEVLRQKIVAGVERQGGMKAKLFHQAVALGRQRYENGRLPVHQGLVDMALDRLVRTKVKERFGGRIKALVSGGAPLNYDVGLFFVALGLPVFQGYGQTEASPVISVNWPGKSRLDTVGLPLEGVDLKIADDGEILVRGDLVMRGYWKDEEATAQTLRDGWLHTGDIGEVNGEGFLKITDRKKDIIVVSGGDNVAPARVEGILLLEPEIGQVLIYGDKRPHLVALVVPHGDFVKSWARERRTSADMEALASDPAFVSAIGEAVKRANQKLSTIERVRRFHVMPEPFSIDNEMMTPTMKLRRHIIIAKHKEIIEGMYHPTK
ncbi:MAG: AMP-dependent synthetase/ligase [Geminicoccaceae bacterium]